jgi:hypothetical protein
VAVHDAVPAPVALRVQVPELLKGPGYGVLENVTVPVGAVYPADAVSVTRAVHTVDPTTAIWEYEQSTLDAVGSTRVNVSVVSSKAPMSQLDVVGRGTPRWSVSVQPAGGV